MCHEILTNEFIEGMHELWPLDDGIDEWLRSSSTKSNKDSWKQSKFVHGAVWGPRTTQIPGPGLTDTEKSGFYAPELGIECRFHRWTRFDAPSPMVLVPCPKSKRIIFRDFYNA